MGKAMPKTIKVDLNIFYSIFTSYIMHTENSIIYPYNNFFYRLVSGAFDQYFIYKFYKLNQSELVFYDCQIFNNKFLELGCFNIGDYYEYTRARK